jgi:hypothetical protein
MTGTLFGLVNNGTPTSCPTPDRAVQPTSRTNHESPGSGLVDLLASGLLHAMCLDAKSLSTPTHLIPRPGRIVRTEYLRTNAASPRRPEPILPLAASLNGLRNIVGPFSVR